MHDPLYTLLRKEIDELSRVYQTALSYQVSGVSMPENAFDNHSMYAWRSFVLENIADGTNPFYNSPSDNIYAIGYSSRTEVGDLHHAMEHVRSQLCCREKAIRGFSERYCSSFFSEGTPPITLNDHDRIFNLFLAKVEQAYKEALKWVKQ